MERRIYFNIIGLMFFCVLVLSSLISFIFYDVTKNGETASIRDRAKLIAELMDRGIGEDYADDGYYLRYGIKFPYKDFVSDEMNTARMTIIAPDGTVMLDNKADAKTLENHGERKEVLDALKTGEGESTRYSDTFKTVTYYYAVRLNDGNILRISKSLHSIIGIFTAVLPAVAGVAALILLLANLVARKLTINIIKPINNIDLNGDNIVAYDELAPFVRKIETQKKEIAEYIFAIENRAAAVNAITENMKEGLILVDKDGLILSANLSASKIFNDTDMTGKNILHVCRDVDLLQKMKLCIEGTPSELTIMKNNKDYVVYQNPVYNSGKINGAVLLFLDVTEKFKAEKQRREFSANVSHELKTPLTTILGLSEMIAGGMVKNDDIAVFGSKISGQTKRLINIINDIIKISEFDEDSIQREFETFDLYKLALSVAEGLRDKAAEKNITIEITGQNMPITANMTMIDELLSNLIDNGIKYNRQGGKVTVSLSDASGVVRVCVADTGIGISKEHRVRVFERFYRADGSRSQKTGGTGLGLSIVKHIAEYHGGRVEIDSRENEGTAVSFIMPMNL